jgi:hypothetical protein
MSTLEQSYQISSLPGVGPSVIDDQSIDDVGVDNDDDLSNLDDGVASNSDDSF